MSSDCIQVLYNFKHFTMPSEKMYVEMAKQIVFHPSSEATQPNVEQDQIAQRNSIETRSVQSLAVRIQKSFLYLLFW